MIALLDPLLLQKWSPQRAFKKIKTPPKLLSGLHSPMPSAKHLENKVIPQKDDIINSILKVIENE